MADIVLVYPKSNFLDTASKHKFLLLGLLNTVVYAHKDYKVKIIDQRVNKNWNKELLNELKKDPFCVGVSSFTGEQILYALEISKLVKENSTVPIVWGGVHPSFLPEQTLKNKYIDIIVQGEGEITFYELVKALENKESLNGIKGIWYKEDGKIKINGLRPQINLDELPELPYHLINISDYMVRFNNKKTLIIETSRGCPYRCGFCYNRSMSNSKWRAQSIEKLKERIEKLRSFGIGGFEIIDDNFFVDLNRAKEFAEMMIQEFDDLFWWTSGVRIDSIDRMDMNYLKLLKRSGCVQLNPGIESGSQRMLNLMKKDISLKQVLSVAEKFKKVNIIPYYPIIIGFPTETEEDLKRTIKLVIKLLKENKRAKVSIFHSFRPTPKTDLYELSLKYGFKPPNKLEDWVNISMGYFNFPWITKKRKKFLKNLYYLSFFLDKKYDYIESPLIKTFAKLYRPIAINRMGKLNFNFMIESLFFNLYFRIFK